jgi:hypothetical protein
MDYDDLYDESPYVSREVSRRGGLMTTIRATFLICATILSSVFALMYYGYQQDQFIVTSSGNFVSIFDRKTRTVNICDKGNCTHISPMFEPHTPVIAGTNPQASLASQIINPQLGTQTGQRVIGSTQNQAHPAAQMTGGQQANPQVGQPQMAAGNAQTNPQMAATGQQPAAGANPQAQQMMQQLQQMEMMAQQTLNQPMTPQRIQLIRQRRALEDQALGGNMLNPQMIQQVRQLRAVEDQQLAQSQQKPNAQATSGNAQAGQAQVIGGAQGQQAAAEDDSSEEGEEKPAKEAATEEKGAEEGKAAEGKAEAESGEETEEAAPV